MIARLLELKPAIDLMAADNQLDSLDPLTQNDWDNLHNISLVLKPFKDAQKLLEGERYVSSSWVIQAVNHIRKRLKAMSADDQPETASKVLAASLLDDFEASWRADNEPVFRENIQRGRLNRQIGIHPVLLVATFLDPRFKKLIPVSDQASKTAIQDRVLQLMEQSEEERIRIENPTANEFATPSEEMEEENQDNIAEADDLLACVEEEQLEAAEADQATAAIDNIAETCADELRRYLAAHPLAIRKENWEW